jgi:hypothetical protein
MKTYIPYALLISGLMIQYCSVFFTFSKLSQRTILAEGNLYPAQATEKGDTTSSFCLGGRLVTLNLGQVFGIAESVDSG